ncbi:MAG: serine/threonine-protein kinase, partial [Polyangiaceae bacterium]
MRKNDDDNRSEQPTLTSPGEPEVERGSAASTKPGAQGSPSGRDANVARQLKSGELVDQFRIVERLGRGGMGEVYLARDMKLGRKVALKLLRGGGLDSEGSLQRFLLEARVTARFSHPNIVTVYAVGDYEGVPYLALEYLRGTNLYQRMRAERYSPREVARIGLAIAKALAEAHRHQVLHRDLKPENVLMPPDGRLRVVDFGLARQLAGPQPGSSPGPLSHRAIEEIEALQIDGREAGGVEGTPLYMAPEQWEGRDLDGAVDVWALGLILYELATGRHPYGGLGYAALSAAARVPDPVPAIADDGTVPLPLVELIADCVAKSSDDRPRAQEVVDRLTAFARFGVGRILESESPFRGLMPFTEQHAAFFFGREAAVARFVEQLRQRPLVPVVGPSGAGKSSFVYAGVIPRLREAERWIVLVMRPAGRPFENLAQTLLSPPDASALQKDDGRVQRDDEGIQDDWTLPAADVQSMAADLKREPGLLGVELRAHAEIEEAKVLLVVDQLEDLVTLVPDASVRAQFMTALLRAADEPLDPVRVVVTVRDDFVSRLATTADGSEALSSMFFLQRPAADALEDTLRMPVEAAGYAHDDADLPTVMVAAVREEPACLPLLQFAAQQLWEGRDRSQHVLRRDVYESIGGVEGALARHADSVLDTLSDIEMRAARQLLLRLVTWDRTRKVVRREELLDDLGEAAAIVLERFTGARLVTVRKDRRSEGARSTVELTHESLITGWKTLRYWIDDGQDELRVLTEANLAADLWEKRGRDEELWQGEALADAVRTLSKSGQSVPGRVQRFVAAAKKKEMRRVRLRRSSLAAIIIGLALVVVFLAWQNELANDQRRVAQQERAAAQEQRAVALVEGARAASGHHHLLEARAKLRMALASTDVSGARALW